VKERGEEMGERERRGMQRRKREKEDRERKGKKE
jgi:hypothetical protein